jgi:hypothetical protein
VKLRFGKLGQQIKIMHQTPWGQSDSIEYYGADGLLFASTPSHGGFYVPNKLIGRIPLLQQGYACRWSGSRHWFEEDCAAIAVLLAFPEYFADQVQPGMEQMLNEYVNAAQAREEIRLAFCGQILIEGGCVTAVFTDSLQRVNVCIIDVGEESETFIVAQRQAKGAKV